ncbi:hypothetical protein B0T20DRAFT_397552 [Sordaria brevicollis]|uniref:Uncharacterized protein n=1 Tax=Sordaria brevicollis TaxID=83679 RepID=A0AAE0NW60_SORBR|nr:hypothetical protein B0T20DRAFT_397552 [Sordaria brevicollis]
MFRILGCSLILSNRRRGFAGSLSGTGGNVCEFPPGGSLESRRARDGLLANNRECTQTGGRIGRGIPSGKGLAEVGRTPTLRYISSLQQDLRSCMRSHLRTPEEPSRLTIKIRVGLRPVRVRGTGSDLKPQYQHSLWFSAPSAACEEIVDLTEEDQERLLGVDESDLVGGNLISRSIAFRRLRNELRALADEYDGEAAILYEAAKEALGRLYEQVEHARRNYTRKVTYSELPMVKAIRNQAVKTIRVQVFQSLQL